MKPIKAWFLCTEFKSMYQTIVLKNVDEWKKFTLGNMRFVCCACNNTLQSKERRAVKRKSEK